jgi:hypothetical protein
MRHCQPSLTCGQKVPCQIHAVMKQSKHIDSSRATDTEYHKMAPLTPLPGDMKCQNAMANLMYQKSQAPLQVHQSPTTKSRHKPIKKVFASLCDLCGLCEKTDLEDLSLARSLCSLEIAEDAEKSLRKTGAFG